MSVSLVLGVVAEDLDDGIHHLGTNTYGRAFLLLVRRNVHLLDRSLVRGICVLSIGVRSGYGHRRLSHNFGMRLLF